VRQASVMNQGPEGEGKYDFLSFIGGSHPRPTKPRESTCLLYLCPMRLIKHSEGG
jgi:hypothetical protein